MTREQIDTVIIGGGQAEVIVTSGSQGTRAAKQSTATIPIVMTNSGYPDKLGLVDSPDFKIGVGYVLGR